jgi:hypothetical protein
MPGSPMRNRYTSLHIALPLLLAFVIFPMAPAQQPKTLMLHAAQVPPRIDGEIDPVWAASDSIADFEQFGPFYGKPPSERTVARFLATDEALYALIVCYSDHAKIEGDVGIHDQTSGDAVSVMLDTFNDRTSAYKLGVSASGAQFDYRMMDDGRNRDASWDGVWFARSVIHPWGYVVEMEIPYKSIRYDGELKEWGLDIDRWIPGTKEDLYWSKYDQAEGQRISKFGHLVLNGARPTVNGLNLEVYPVAVARAEYDPATSRYKVEPDAGIDIFYNPSEKLTFQLTGNPDFAQIEADPFEFNISRYETYYSERRPFFTTGNEVFMAAGRENNSGFYRPLELFYSRRIGQSLSDGSRVPLNVGAKTFGRLGPWAYGAFLASTGGVDYDDDGTRAHEPEASFASFRIKRQIFENSSIGVLFVGKQTPGRLDGVLDVDGAFRSSSYQLAYQFARSMNNGKGDFAGSAGLRMFTKEWGTLVRTRAIGKEFDVDAVGYVPWKGTANLTVITGPMTYYEEGELANMFNYGGFSVTYEDVDLATDWVGALGMDMSFRSNWGLETTIVAGQSKDEGVRYDYFEFDHSMWFNISPRWNANVWGGYSHGYNFSREYVAGYIWFGSYIDWKALSTLSVGTSYNMYIEKKPDGSLEDITYNARPYISLTPVNNLNMRVYMDNVFLRSSDQMEHVIVGFLFSYNFLPKSWIYLALNEVQERRDMLDAGGATIGRRMEVAGRAGVTKLKYLYYL